MHFPLRSNGNKIPATDDGKTIRQKLLFGVSHKTSEQVHGYSTRAEAIKDMFNDAKWKEDMLHAVLERHGMIIKNMVVLCALERSVADSNLGLKFVLLQNVVDVVQDLGKN